MVWPNLLGTSEPIAVDGMDGRLRPGKPEVEHEWVDAEWNGGTCLARTKSQARTGTAGEKKKMLFI